MASQETVQKKIAKYGATNVAIIAITRDNAYCDRIRHNGLNTQYAGQKRRTTFDGIIVDHNIPLYMVEQKAGHYSVLGKCTNRTLPVCRAQSQNNIPRFFMDIVPVDEATDTFMQMRTDAAQNVVFTGQHIYRKQFLYNYKLEILVGGTGDGLWLVRRIK